mmetsp:Transcript_30031/g.87873  ORF Transcript_30031/g.87873 Transcript_30031/m.87873 type:complete len:248 (+) Transcript_30031:693-1436(+)
MSDATVWIALATCRCRSVAYSRSGFAGGGGGAGGGAEGRTPGGKSLPMSRGKRRRDEEDAAGEGDEGVTVTEEGKIAVSAAAAGTAQDGGAAAVGGFAGGQAGMEVDPLDEIVRPGAAKRRRGLENEKVEASAAEVADPKAAKEQQQQLGRRVTLAKARRAAAADDFGANLGERFKSKKGAAGDVMRPGGQQPYAYLPLNPRLLGKKQQRNAKATMGKLMAKKSKVVKSGRKHGIEARRGRGKASRK